VAAAAAAVIAVAVAVAVVAETVAVAANIAVKRQAISRRGIRKSPALFLFSGGKLSYKLFTIAGLTCGVICVNIVLMRTKLFALFAVCLMATAAIGAETYESFAKESLGIDLTTVPFGVAAQTNDGFQGTTAPLSGVGLPDAVDFLWTTNEISVKYQRDFPNRVVRFGFSDHTHKLAAVRVSISMYGGPGFAGDNSRQEIMAQRRKELIQIQDSLVKTRKAEKIASNPGRYEIRSGAMCSPAPDSLVLLELQITLRDDKEPAGSGLDIHP
jgi:hypothetical protein